MKEIKIRNPKFFFDKGFRKELFPKNYNAKII